MLFCTGVPNSIKNIENESEWFLSTRDTIFSMDIEKVFSYTSEKMKLEWKQIRESFKHSGNKGTSLEDAVHEFLKDYLPESLGITKGEIIDSKGKHSKQIDAIIFDKAKAIKLYNTENIRILPVECVYAVIEIKSNIDSERTIEKIFENMLSVKKLEKIAYVQPTRTSSIDIVDIYGEDWPIWPIQYFVFAIDSMDLEELWYHIDQKHKEMKLPVSSRIDCVCVLNGGVISNKTSDGKFDACPELNSELTFTKTKNALLLFYVLISKYTNQAWLPEFNFKPYLGDMTFGSNDKD